MKTIKAEQFNPKGIYTVKDLFKIESLQALKNDLISKWNDCILFEHPIDKDDESINKLQVSEWSNQNTWIGYKKHI